MKFFSLIMSFFLSIFGVAPPAQSVDAYTQAEWYALVAEEFDLAYSLEDNDNYNIAADDEYFAAIQACHDNNVIVGEYDADAYVTNVLVGKSLAVAVELEGTEIPNEAALDVAVDAGFVKVSVNLFGKVKEVVMTKAEADAALEAASVVYAKKIQAYTQAEWYTLVAKSLIVAVGLKLPGVSDEVAVYVAVNAGFVNASVNINGKV